MSNFTPIVFLIFCFQQISGQSTMHKGYVYESGNRGYLNTAELIFFNDKGEVLDTCFTNIEGYYEIALPEYEKYEILVQKNMFESKRIEVSNSNSDLKKALFSKIEMVRSPGYIFEVTLANKSSYDLEEVDAVKGTTIEVYNNTLHKEEMVLKDYMEPEFKVPLLKGNHYTLLIRKPEYLARRIEAYVDVEGCILCFEGLGSVSSGVSDNLSEGNQIGVLLANIELERIFKGKKVTINNLYYEVAKWGLNNKSKEELDKVVDLLADNQNAKVELGAHTDSRGSFNDNLILSQKRAKWAVDYLVRQGVDSEQIVARGYGENELINDCTDDVECSEEQHFANRRTELKILSLVERQKEMKSLFEIKKEERMDAILEEIQFSGQIRIPLDSSFMVEKIELESTAPKENIANDRKEDQPVNYDSEDTKIVIETTAPKENIVNDTKADKPENYNSGDTKIVIESTAPKENIVIETKADQSVNYNFGITKIVIKDSYTPLPDGHEIFDRHPNLLEYKYRDGKYYYLIGLFNSQKEGEDFMKQTILLTYPDAYIVNILNGELRKI